MRKSVFIVAILASMLVGCAQPPIWIKAGATQQDYATDSYQCEKDARQSGYYGGGMMGVANMVSFSDRCMMAHGWRKENAAQAVVNTPIAGNTAQTIPTPSPSNSGNDLGVTNFSREKIAISGELMNIDAYLSLNPDCTSNGLPAVRVVTPPLHGSLMASEGTSYPAYPASNQRFQCNLNRSPAMLVYYRSKSGFVGKDTVGIYVIFRSGNLRTVTYNLTVR